MSHTAYRLYAHITWHTWKRRQFVRGQMVEDIESALSTACERTGVHMLSHAILSDHMHVLASLRPDTRISDFIRYAKSISSLRVARAGCTSFQWARGFYAGSVSPGHLVVVRNYVDKQLTRHGALPA